MHQAPSEKESTLLGKNLLQSRSLLKKKTKHTSDGVVINSHWAVKELTWNGSIFLKLLQEIYAVNSEY